MENYHKKGLINNSFSEYLNFDGKALFLFTVLELGSVF